MGKKRGAGVNGYITVQDMRIDIRALSSLSHRCQPLKCRTRERGCCATYEVAVSRREQGTIIGTLPQASQYATRLHESSGFIEAFEDTDGGTCLSTDEDGRCVFAYDDREGATLCSLHSAALDMDLPPAEVKPRSCALWPLALAEGDPPILTLQEGALGFPCNETRQGPRGLDEGVSEIIATMFGHDFLAELLRAL